jgi:hypothetical protein
MCSYSASAVQNISTAAWSFDGGVAAPFTSQPVSSQVMCGLQQRVKSHQVILGEWLA